MATTLFLPAPVCLAIAAVAFGSLGRFGVASEDGTVRVYDAPYHKVTKAVKTTSPEISSLRFRPEAEDEELWIACGQHVLCFSLDDPRIILERKDARLDVRLTEEEDDVLNEINIDMTHLAYTLDSGSVGILDLESHQCTRMKTPHTNICSNASFIPNRRCEIVSGGYDSALLHFDFGRGVLLSSFQLSGPTEASAQVSLSPPFVLSLAISEAGLVACGLADGRVCIGSGGEKAWPSEENSSTRKKRRRKWEGLRAEDIHYHKVAEGPVVAVAFASAGLLLSLSLLGTLILHRIKDGLVQETIWTANSPGLAKANALAVYESLIAIGGISTDTKGIFLLRPLHPEGLPPG